MNQSGTVYKVGDTEQVTNTFRKRELIIEVPGQYPQFLKFEAKQDRVSLLDNIKEGQTVDIHFNLEGRLHKDTCFNTLTIWKIA